MYFSSFKTIYYGNNLNSLVPSVPLSTLYFYKPKITIKINLKFQLQNLHRIIVIDLVSPIQLEDRNEVVFLYKSDKDLLGK